MLHENRAANEVEPIQVSRARQKWSIGLLLFFSSVYALFIGLCAFAYGPFAKLEYLGIPAPVWYGLGLILLAIGIAGLYGHVTRVKRR